MRLAERIEVAFGAHAVARAAVAGLVNVEAELAIGRKAGDPGVDAHFAADLHEAHAAAHRTTLGWLEIRGRSRPAAGHALGPAQQCRHRKTCRNREKFHGSLLVGPKVLLPADRRCAIAYVQRAPS